MDAPGQDGDRGVHAPVPQVPPLVSPGLDRFPYAGPPGWITESPKRLWARPSLPGWFPGIVGEKGTIALLLKFPHSLRIQVRHEHRLEPDFLLRWVVQSRCVDHIFWVVCVVACPSDIQLWCYGSTLA